MKKLFKGVMGIASFAVVIAGAYYLTRKFLGEADEELDDAYDDLDFEDEDETDAKSREYVTLDFEEDGEESAEQDAQESAAESEAAEDTQESEAEESAE